MDTQEIKNKVKEAKQDLSGVAVDIADAEKETGKMVDDMTRMLNNNHAGDNDKQ